tara:strand:+ start:263 stop:583 length:321 start_codon:yes stop_codon:yes gene_type:complete
VKDQVNANSMKLLKTLVAPVVSEKSTYVGEKNNQVVFRVAENANKSQIKAAVELLFKVEVEKVSVLRVKGKEKRYGRSIGRRRNWRKAYVCLKPGQELNLVAGEGS